MHGKFPQILSDEKVGKEATKLYNDAQAIAAKKIKRKNGWNPEPWSVFGRLAPMEKTPYTCMLVKCLLIKKLYRISASAK